MVDATGQRFRCVLPSAQPEALLPDSHPLLQQLAADEQAASGASAHAKVGSIESVDTERTEADAAAGAAAASAAAAVASAAAAAVTVAQLDPAAVRARDEATIPALVRKHLGTGCFTRQVDYWTYEVCPFRSVRQYHRAPDTQGVGLEFSLGLYIGQTGDRYRHPGVAYPPGSIGLLPAGSSVASQLTYSQLYDGGANNRQSIVTFACYDAAQGTAANAAAVPENGNLQHLLLSVAEPKPFNYEFLIVSSLLCRNAQNGLLGSPKAVTPAASAAATAAKKQAHVPAGATAPPTKLETGRLLTGSTRRKHGALAAERAATAAASPGPSPPGAARLSPSASVSMAMDVLEPLGSECLYLNSGWWTYKFCYLKTVTQFHREQVVLANPNPQAAAAGGKVNNVKLGAKSAAEAAANLAEARAAGNDVTLPTKLITTAEFVLGQLPADMSLEALESGTRVVVGDSWEHSYVSQRYTDGTLCDLSQRPRQIESRLFCNLHEPSSTIKSVVENATCEYTIIVHTPLLCAHPQFKPQAPKIAEIVCEPIGLPAPQTKALELNLKLSP